MVFYKNGQKRLEKLILECLTEDETVEQDQRIMNLNKILLIIAIMK